MLTFPKKPKKGLCNGGHPTNAGDLPLSNPSGATTPQGINPQSKGSWLEANQDASTTAAGRHGWKNSWYNGARNTAPSGKPSNNTIWVLTSNRSPALRTRLCLKIYSPLLPPKDPRGLRDTASAALRSLPNAWCSSRRPPRDLSTSVP